MKINEFERSVLEHELKLESMTYVCLDEGGLHSRKTTLLSSDIQDTGEEEKY